MEEISFAFCQLIVCIRHLHERYKDLFQERNPNAEDNDILNNARYYVNAADQLRSHVSFRTGAAEWFYLFDAQSGIPFGNGTGRLLLIRASKFLLE